MLKQFADTKDAGTSNFVAWTCSLAPEAIPDLAPVISLARNAAKSDPKSAQFQTTLGAILYRAGRFEESDRMLKEADSLAQKPGIVAFSRPYTRFFIAMTHQRLHQSAEATEWLDKAVNESNALLKGHETGTAKLPWNRRLTLTLLRREAESLIARSPNASAKADVRR